MQLLRTQIYPVQSADGFQLLSSAAAAAARSLAMQLQGLIRRWASWRNAFPTPRIKIARQRSGRQHEAQISVCCDSMEQASADWQDNPSIGIPSPKLEELGTGVG